MRTYSIGLVFICLTTITLMFAGCGGDSGSAPAPAPTTQATVIPPPPTGVAATGGATQVTIRWEAAPGATSYNIYWSTIATSTVWHKIANATAPYVQTGLATGTTYYYMVTAVNSAGESLPSSQVFAWTNSLPTAPTMVVATGGVGQVTLTWNPVPGATSYNLYWSTDPGVLIMVGGDTADPLPIRIDNVTSPFVWNTTVVQNFGINQSGGTIDPSTFVVLANTTYYFVVTAVTSAGEVPSQEVSATTL
ncbi:MAG TPA: fibronectin type III domain-containing protein [Geobacteraceae bacterium]